MRNQGLSCISVDTRGEREPWTLLPIPKNGCSHTFINTWSPWRGIPSSKHWQSRTFHSHYIVHKSKEGKKKSIRLLWLGTLWEGFFKSQCLKIPWNVGMCNNSQMGENKNLTLSWKHLHFNPKWEHPLIQEPFAKNKVIVFFLIHNRTQNTTYSAPENLIIFRCLEPHFSLMHTLNM